MIWSIKTAILLCILSPLCPSHQSPTTSFRKNSHLEKDKGNQWIPFKSFDLEFSVQTKNQSQENEINVSGFRHTGDIDSVENLLGFIYATLEEKNGYEVAYQLLLLIETELDADHQFVHEITNLISDTEQKQQYFDSTKIISNSLQSLKNYAETGGKSDRIKFLETTGDLETSLLSLYNDFSNISQPNQRRKDILNICKSHFQCHQREVVKCANSFLKLIEAGTVVLAGFYRLEDRHSTREWEVTKANLLRNHKQIETRIILLTKKCATPAPDSLRNEMAKLMVTYSSLDNKKMADKLFEYLRETYKTKNWLVIVYDGIEGGHSHWQSGFYNDVFRQDGKIALVVSRTKLSQKNQEVPNDSLTESNLLTEAVKMSCKSQCDGDDAHQLVVHLSRNNVLAECTLFAIDSSANVVKRVDPNFVPHFFGKLYTKAKTFVVLAIKNEFTDGIKTQTFDLRGQRLTSDLSGCARLQSSWTITVITTCILSIAWHSKKFS